MSIYKCKMCGGALEISGGESVAVCEYCGTKQTVPRLDDEKRANLYDRANHFFRNDEFDKAMGIYEQILSEDKTDAEAYWSIVLCRYGVEYVEDPATHKRVPTVNRTQFASIFSDEDYKSALEYADGYQKSIYEEQAKIIDKIQKDILAISQQEEPFDVFICYKESDNGGRRTPDSVLANELYHELTEEGFKVFYSRITLEDKIGTAYEPYIFSALNSAKVMVVLGTRAEYFQAAWVKNEWSRYLALIRNGEKKMLIPAYRDMDPYDLPEEFSHLQAQDMSKLGFVQDLVRGIKKIAQVEEEKPVVVKEVITTESDVKITSLLKRVFLFLEDDDFENAEEYCERVLDIEPECGEAYLGKLMVELEVEKREELADLAEPFDDSGNYQKILRFGDEKLVAEVVGYNNYIVERNELEQKKKIYGTAINIMRSTANAEGYQEAAKLFGTIGTYEDSEELAKQCREKARIHREQKERRQRDQIYDSGISYMATVSVASYEMAMEKFGAIPGWRDADEKREYCGQKLYELRRQRAEEKKRKKRKMYVGVALAVLVIPLLIVAWSLAEPWLKLSSAYNSAMELYEAEKYEEAYAAFKNLSYKDSEEMAQSSRYNWALDLYERGWYQTAYIELKGLNEDLPYKDSEERAKSILSEHPAVAQVGDCITFGKYEQNNEIGDGKEEIEWLVYWRSGNEMFLVSKDILDCQPYDMHSTRIQWEKCSLNQWLNNTFINEAFTEEEQKLILEHDGEKVFVLNLFDAGKSFVSGEEKICEATPYAQANGLRLDEEMGAYRWWIVDNQGDCRFMLLDVEHGVAGTADYIGVRPAIRISNLGK